jgi:hypothetical protein
VGDYRDSILKILKQPERQFPFCCGHYRMVDFNFENVVCRRIKPQAGLGEALQRYGSRVNTRQMGGGKMCFPGNRVSPMLCHQAMFQSGFSATF